MRLEMLLLRCVSRLLDPEPTSSLIMLMCLQRHTLHCAQREYGMAQSAHVGSWRPPLNRGAQPRGDAGSANLR
jgi:hypothetical protein